MIAVTAAAKAAATAAVTSAYIAMSDVSRRGLKRDIGRTSAIGSRKDTRAHASESESGMSTL